MKYTFFILASVFSSLANASLSAEEVSPQPTAAPVPETHFVSTVQWVVNDSNPELIRRSQAVLIEEFNQAVVGVPSLRELPFDVRTAGNEVIFYASSNSDNRKQIQDVIRLTIDHVQDKVNSHGRSFFYRTVVMQQQEPEHGYLSIKGQPNRKGIVSVMARAVPVRDLLRELKNRLRGVGLSYVIPGECADRVVDWTLPPTQAVPTKGPYVVPVNGVRDAETVMAKLAADLDLGYDMAGSTFIFKGNCPVDQARAAAAQNQNAMIRTSLSGPGQSGTQYMFVPVFSGWN